MNKLRKLLQFSRLYGWPRTAHKVAGRLRFGHIPLIVKGKKETVGSISVIGCGQFAFSTLCYFVQQYWPNAFLSAYDTDSRQAQSLAQHWGFREVAPTPEAVFTHPSLRLVYIAANHASHTPYAIEGLRRGLDVYLEKPIAVSREQLVALSATYRQAVGQLWAGYNRPYARAIQLLKERVLAQPAAGPFSISYIVNGHFLPADHWYRHPNEGTRICGNLGHWLDLTVHCWAWRQALPTWVDVQMAWANPTERDDNLAITLTTDCHDLVTLVLTARTEPSEGIREFMNLQYGNLIAQVDDFQQLTCWEGTRKQRWQFTPKDVGHERAALQPFCTDNRPWAEVELSTLLMLFIRDALLTDTATARFTLPTQLARFNEDIQQYRDYQPLPTNH